MNYAFNEERMMEGIRAYLSEGNVLPKRKPHRKQKPFCKRGHPLNSKNVYLHPSKGYAVCKLCTALHGRCYYRRNKSVLREKKRIYYYTKKANPSRTQRRGEGV